MNVMEETLREKIDPYLTPDRLSLLASRALGRPLSAVSARVLTGGCWSRVVSVAFSEDEPEVVMKISPESGDAAIEREFEVLTVFSTRTAMPVPEPYLVDLSGEVLPGTVLVMKKIPGDVMHHVFHRLPGPVRVRLTREIARYVAELHRTRSVGFGSSALPEEARHASWPEFWLPRFDTVFGELAASGLVDGRFLREVERVRPAFPRFLEIGGESTLTHYDVWSGNVMIDGGTAGRGDARVSGFIDIPGNWADYARELSFAELFGVADDEFYAVYTDHHPLDDGFDLRKDIYNLKMTMKHIMMYPGEGFYRSAAARCLDSIRRTV